MLAPLLASPASRVAIILGRGLPVMGIGLLVSFTSFAFGRSCFTWTCRPARCRRSC